MMPFKVTAFGKLNFIRGTITPANDPNYGISMESKPLPDRLTAEKLRREWGDAVRPDRWKFEIVEVD